MKADRPKILFFITEDWFVCSHWLPLIDGARKAGFEVIVATRVNKHAEEILRYGVRVIPFEISRSSSNVLREFWAILRLAKIYHEERPDIVHHIAVKPILYGSLVSHLLRIPHTVNWVAGMGWLFISNNWRARLLQSVIKKILGILLRETTVIVENHDDQEIVARVGVAVQRIHLVRGAGVDTSQYAPSAEPDGIPLVVLPARLLWDKGVREFVDAAKHLQQRGVKARFALVGAPDSENPASVTVGQLEAWQKTGAVEWWGRRDDMPFVLANSHIVCLPSYREGLPKSLLEAASCGRPIVTTDVPGCREVVRDRDNGFLVEVRNETALADAIAKLLADANLRQQMGQRGRDRVLSEFSQERIVAQVLALYRDVLSIT